MKSYTLSKKEIEGYNNVSETVQTIEKIAASGVHMLKKDIHALQAYTQTIEKTLTRLSVCSQATLEHPLLNLNMKGKDMLVVFSGNRGLVGGLWDNLFDLYLNGKRKEQLILTVGSKAHLFFGERVNQDVEQVTFEGEIPTDTEVTSLCTRLMQQVQDGSIARVTLLYPKNVSIGNQQPTLLPFLPFDISGVYDPEDVITNNPIGLPIFEASATYLFGRLLEIYINATLYNIALETRLSELSARTVSMEHASEKTKEMVTRLRLVRSRTRRQLLTQKQLESFAAQKKI